MCVCEDFLKPSVFLIIPYMCLIYLDCSVLLFFFVSLLQHLAFCFYLFTPLCCCHHLVSFIITLFPVLFFPHMVSPLSSPLLSTPFPPHPSALVSPSSIRHRLSQRHSQTGGGVKRRWAPGNPRGAFQWQGPQVKMSRAELWRCSNRLEESEGEEQAVSTGP